MMTRNIVVRVLPCRHMFHQKCIEALIAVPNANCPNCRGNILNSEIQERKIYNKNSEQDRMRIVSCANRGEDWTTLATSLNINFKTASHWVRSGTDVMLKKGGVKPKLLNEEKVNRIVEWIEMDCSLTLKQLKDKILGEFNQTISIASVSNYLEGRLFTSKKMHCEPINMNSEQNKRKRLEYVEALNT